MFLFLVMNCTPLKSKISKEVELKTANKKEIKEPITTEFYQILAFATPRSRIYKLKDRKSFDLKISNIGTKDLFVPKWFDKSSGKASELYIELYKQESKIVQKNIHTRTMNRSILSSKNGEWLCFENLELDAFLTIVDKGKYLAKIYIDLSNFGYFKIIESSAFFEVVSDSTDIEELKKSNIDILKRTDAEQYSADLKLRMEANNKKKSKAKKRFNQLILL